MPQLLDRGQVATYLPTLPWASVALGLGLFLRVVADAGQTFAGGTVTGFRAGEAIEVDEPER